ncbi:MULTISPECIES: response regulator [unclassified Olleya]|jgi:DNA-binding NarL/FixJ family response regulator|uniref:response regulator n=1 Tax=unclassified Olleya TaxID=2615019 RepID=UPI0011A699C9|nr:response regulator [Olleya sp. Hel_I_94]TVZ47335.1 DNA-binding NarL/FixJ family response regulator [Olleya sp. Hel_I_94]
MDTDQIKIIIADDNKFFAQALKESLEKNPKLKIIKMFYQLDDLANNCSSFYFDILILDINFKGENSLLIIDQLKSKLNVFKIIILTTLVNNYTKKLAASNGVFNFKSKDETLHNFDLELIKIVKHEDNNNTQKVYYKKTSIASVKLTDTKINILQELYTSASLNEELIAKKLNISIATLKTHKQQLFALTGTKNVSHLIKFGIKNGIILP